MPEEPRSRKLILSIDSDLARAQTVLKAMASEPRLRILELLTDKMCNISEIGEALGMPFSTANLHINILEEAGLLLAEHKPAARGSQKICTRAYNTVVFEHSTSEPHAQQTVELAMPIGAYVSAQTAPTCGMAGETGIIGLLDDPISFYEPDRTTAQLLWFHHGYVEYHFPNRLPPNTVPESLHLSLEVCSEAPLHHNEWPSDITVWINGVEIGTWTSPSDFGGQRGILTPAWWESHNSQYGLLKVWQVNDEASLVDGLRISNVRVADLNINDNKYVSVRIGVKESSRHVGGINIFGRSFGNYPQDIMLRMRYT